MTARLLRTVRSAARLPGFVYRHARANGVDGIGRAMEQTSATAVAGACRAVEDRLGPLGTPVWERDWDVLVVLDACRVDLLREVRAEYPFLGGRDAIGTHWSIASKSDDWLRRTFAHEYAGAVEGTAYVTGNPFTAKVRFEATPAVLDEVWRYGWDEELSTIPARPITDRAIDTWREGDVSRMIVHYMQPHGPFVHHPEMGTYGGPEDFGEGFGDIWGRAGHDIPTADIRRAYRENLRYVLGDVELLLENLDADRVAITADHGNALGEFGVYGHPSDVLVPAIRRVPWVRTTGRDTGDYRPTTERESARTGVEDRLRHLGYTD